MRVIPTCGDIDSLAPPSARTQARYLVGPPYVAATDVPEGRTQHESGSARFGISFCWRASDWRSHFFFLALARLERWDEPDCPHRTDMSITRQSRMVRPIS